MFPFQSLSEYKLFVLKAVPCFLLFLDVTNFLSSFHEFPLSSWIHWCRAVRIAPFSNRLAHSAPSNIQGLRCFTNYEALQFSQPIRFLGENMVDRMVKNSSMSGGKYVSVHLRFEKVLLQSLIKDLKILYTFS